MLNAWTKRIYQWRPTPAWWSIAFLIGVTASAACQPQAGGGTTTASAPASQQSQAAIEEYRRHEQQFIDAYKSKDFESARKHGEAIMKLRPDHMRTMYRLACVNSMLKKPDEVYWWLEKAIEHGFMDVDLLERDVNFAIIHDEARFREITGSLREKLGRNSAGGMVWRIRLPADYDANKPTPMIFALHAFVGNADVAIRQWETAADQMGCIIVAPQGPVEVDPGAYQWVGGGNDVYKVVDAALADARTKYNIDPKRQFLAGFSQGGWAAFQLLGRAPEQWCGLITISGRFEDRWKDMYKPESLTGKRVYLMTGEKDQYNAKSRSAQDSMTRAGAEVYLREYPGRGHGLPPDGVNEEIAAIEFVLNGTTPSRPPPAAPPASASQPASP